MIRILIDASARLRATARDPNSTVKDSDLPRGFVDLPAVPRQGEWIEWPDGAGYTVHRVSWLVGQVGQDGPMLVLD